MGRRITALTAQKNNPQKVNVFLDGEYAFSLARLVAAWLKVGDSLDEEKITLLQQNNQREEAYQAGIRLLSFRNRTKSEIEKRLIEKGFPLEVVQETLSKMVDEKLIDDSRYAVNYVEYRSGNLPRSRRFLAYELRQKGIDDEIAATAIQEIADDLTLAKQAAEKYVSRLHGLENEVFRRRLTGYLGRRGFSYDVITEVIREIMSGVKNKMDKE
ncbi:MAG TPA: RecX family transcriptional regulator [Anaerolineaceae bacterium]